MHLHVGQNEKKTYQVDCSIFNDSAKHWYNDMLSLPNEITYLQHFRNFNLTLNFVHVNVRWKTGDSDIYFQLKQQEFEEYVSFYLHFL